jgi:HD superfamily phosphohydrolase
MGNKIIRDQVLGYVRLSEAEIRVVDTPHFQRLRDVRQLTCHHVYPSALHTRFDHSLGTMELTGKAIEHINKNSKTGMVPDFFISDELRGATAIAALLHDVGQPPFSHLGEAAMDVLAIRDAVLYELEKAGIEDGELFRAVPEQKSVHELTSCVIFLRHYLGAAVDADKATAAFIIRCILGLKYRSDVPERNAKNLLISLINSRYFDMDKLDYIMRDSFHTGISAPPVDLTRLFENICAADIGGEAVVAFKSKAVPVLQDIIDARDILRMRVYNHHTAVYSNFLYGYIFRRTGIGEMLTLEGIADKFYADSDVLAALNALRDENVFAKSLLARDFLKPWWKTLYEYERFMAAKFADGEQRAAAEALICAGGKEGEEARSAIVRGVLAGTRGMETELCSGDFFLAHTSHMFFEMDAVKNFYVYLKGGEKFVELTKLLPIKDYDGWYGKNSFYVYMRQGDEGYRRRVEDIFVDVVVKASKK